MVCSENPPLVLRTSSFERWRRSRTVSSIEASSWPLGISSEQIQWRLADGRLVAPHRGVYLVGAVAPEWAYPQAALFACGARSALFSFSALAVWKLRPYPSQANPWVLVPPERRIERPRINVRRGLVLPRDIRHRHGLRLTSPPRAVLDAAAFLDDPYELEALVAEAHYRGLAKEPELRAQIERYRGNKGVGALRSVLDIEGGPQRTRSKGERAMLRILRRHKLKGFEANGRICGWEVDFLWRDEAFCIELDGWDAHSSRTAFERDRLKWADLQAKGVAVMPITGRQARQDEAGVVARVLAVLTERRKQQTFGDF